MEARTYILLGLRSSWLIGLTLMAMLIGVDEPRRAAPLSNPGSWISPEDYPAEANRRGSQGTTQFRVTVNDRGRPISCRIEVSSNDQSLDEATCRLVLERARFRPARDHRGEAVADEYFARVRWVLADDPFRVGLEPFRVVNIRRIEADGSVICSTTYNDLAPPPDEAHECEGLNSQETQLATTLLSGRSAQVSEVAIYTPGATPAPPFETQHLGNMFHSSELRLSVAPDGRVAECRIVRQASEPGQPQSPPFDHCEYYSSDDNDVFLPMPELSEARIVRVTIDYFVRFSSR